jgi:hypothetical protein
VLRGRFGDTSGRPYIEGRLFFPRLKIGSNISFCVDTGADRSVLMPGDGKRMRLDYSKLKGSNPSVGVGGICHNYVESALVVFSEPKRYLHVYDIALQVSAPDSEIMDLPSLLGRDILNKWRMIYNPSKNRLFFEVISADVTVPIT